MADNRGGYRKPSGGPRVSGPGAASQRSDANQPVDVGRVGDSEDLKHGDRQKLEAALRQRPLGRAPSPSPALASAPPRGGSATAAGGGAGPPPEHLVEIPSTRETEPVTEGLPFGPGAGPEVLEPEPQDEADIVLQAMVELTGDQSIAQMLDEHREFKSWRATRSAVPTPAPTPVLATEGEMAGGEDELSVETPAIPSEAPVEGGGEFIEPAGVLSAEIGGDAEMV